ITDFHAGRECFRSGTQMFVKIFGEDGPAAVSVADEQGHRHPSPSAISPKSARRMDQSARAVHAWASGPLPIVGKAVIRSRAAPIGIRVMVSSGSSERTGLGRSLPTRPFLSSVQPRIFFPLALI